MEMAEIWDSVETLHHELHKTGDSRIDCIKKGDKDCARRILADDEKISTVIFGKFEQMICLSGELDKRRERVF